MAFLQAGGVLGRTALMTLLSKVRLSKVRSRAAVVISLALLVFLAPSACQIVGGYASFTPHKCHLLPASKFDDAGVELVLSKQTDETCYWIDQTEVTVGQYQAFLAGAPRPIDWGNVDPSCVWKALPVDAGAEASSSPEAGSQVTAPSDPANDMNDPCRGMTNGESDPFNVSKPIRCVDWCDAKAYCQWAGEDLCGGTSNTGAIVVPMDVRDQWGESCAGDKSFPYGDGTTPMSGACNVGLEDAGLCLAILKQDRCAPTEVGKFPACTGPSGTVDMIGNVAEWVLQCGVIPGGGTGGADVKCQHRGGSFADDLDVNCYTVAADLRSYRDTTLGLRCCADLTDSESRLVR
jgi:formylglycine-generating enzyme required for sulfatase activity